MSKYCLVQSSFSDSAEAHKLARQIIEAKLGACSQVSSPRVSYYRWKNEIQNEEEVVLSIKTTADKVDALEQFILKNHSYDTPEIISIVIDHVSQKYAAWLDLEMN